MRDYKILIDTPSKSPALGFDEYAEALGDIMTTSKPQFAVGIYGTWGSGKTTLMGAVESKLTDNNNIITVNFTAWRYEKEEHLIIPLLATIKDSLIEWQSRQSEQDKKAIASTIKTIGNVITSLTAGLSFKLGIPKIMEISFDASKALKEADRLDSADEKENADTKELTSLYYTCFNALKSAFEAFHKHIPDRRFVIFIDDLDRCLPKGVLQVMESMKVFFDLHGFIFVVGLDRPVVEWCIDTAYAEHNNIQDDKGRFQIRGRDYLKKIFQVPFTLFPVSISQIDEFLDTLIDDNNLCRQQSHEIKTIVQPHLDFIIEDSGVNPREIKRFINAYTLHMKIKPNLNKNAVLALRTIALRSDWLEVQKAINIYDNIFLKALKRYVGSEKDSLKNLDEELNIPESFITYVSHGAPGNALLDVDRLGDYIRSGATIGSSSSPELIKLINFLGKNKNIINEITSSNALLSLSKELSLKILKEQESLQYEKTNPLIAAANRSLANLISVLDRIESLLDRPEELEKWKKDVKACLAKAISAIVLVYHSRQN